MKLNQKGFIVEAIAAVIALACIAGLVIGVVAFVGWNNNRNHTLGRGDADTGVVNRDARNIYEAPDRFSNVAKICDDKGNAIYVTTKSDYSRAIFALKDGCE